MGTATRYVWNKYSCSAAAGITTGSTWLSSGSQAKASTILSGCHIILAKSATYSNGTWTLSNTKHVGTSAPDGTTQSSPLTYSASTYPYLCIASSGSATSVSTGYIFMTSGSYWYLHANGASISSNEANVYIYAKNSTVYHAIYTTTYTKGSTDYGYVSSASAGTYPSDGAYGSYWYTYLGTDSFGLDSFTLSPSTPVSGSTVTISFTPVINTYGGTITYQYWYEFFTEDQEALSSGSDMTISDYDLTLLSETTGTSVTLDVSSDAAYMVVVVFAVSDGLGWTSTGGGYYKYAAVYTYTAPTAPEDIGADGSTYTGMIFTGDTITVTWPESTDADDDLAGYTVQRSYNGGSYTSLYQGSALTCTDTAASSWTTVQYRVRAYDSQGLYSDWTYSGEYEVDENTAPSAPTAVTITSSIYIDVQFTVSWTASTDAESDTVYYEVAVSYDSGSTWTTVTSKTTATSLTATITSSDIATVQYRVRAYDMYGAYSDWTYSSSRTVISNTAPILTVTIDGTECESGTDLGELTDPDTGFTMQVIFSDDDGDDVTIRQYLDGTQFRSRASGQSSGTSTTAWTAGGTWDWQTILNGEHTLKVTATDGTETVTWTATYTKAVDTCTIGKAAAVSTGSTITGVLMSITGSIPGDATVTVKVTADGTNWEDASTEVLAADTYYFTNTGDSFDFEVSIDGNGTDGYVTSIQGVLITE